jgi:hypothetical protein
MPASTWKETINVRPFFQNKGDEHFEANRDGIVETLRRSRWYSEFVERPCVPSLRICVDELARADFVEDFDYYWNLLYVLADRDRIWIKTR